jgi:hypothetical protein
VGNFVGLVDWIVAVVVNTMLTDSFTAHELSRSITCAICFFFPSLVFVGLQTKSRISN